MFSSEVCSTFTAMSSRTLLWDHTHTHTHTHIYIYIYIYITILGRRYGTRCMYVYIYIYIYIYTHTLAHEEQQAVSYEDKWSYLECRRCRYGDPPWRRADAGGTDKHIPSSQPPLRCHYCCSYIRPESKINLQDKQHTSCAGVSNIPTICYLKTVPMYVYLLSY